MLQLLLALKRAACQLKEVSVMLLTFENLQHGTYPEGGFDIAFGYWENFHGDPEFDERSYLRGFQQIAPLIESIGYEPERAARVTRAALVRYLLEQSPTKITRRRQ